MGGTLQMLCGFRFLDVWCLLREGALGFVLKVEGVGKSPQDGS